MYERDVLHISVLLFGMQNLRSPPIQFYFVREHKTQLDAKTHCRDKYTDLVTIHNVTEMRAVMAAVDGSDSDFVWIGLERETSPNFIWSNTKFNDLSCSTALPFIFSYKQTFCFINSAVFFYWPCVKAVFVFIYLYDFKKTSYPESVQIT
uniref:C-type lectin domain-containing protein n=1 Tax=Pygocentrus nattereri TaxID=42514 RepID=A0A3B4ELF3_PYGNA